MVLVGHWIAFMGDTPGITLNSVDVQKGQALLEHHIQLPAHLKKLRIFRWVLWPLISALWVQFHCSSFLTILQHFKTFWSQQQTSKAPKKLCWIHVWSPWLPNVISNLSRRASFFWAKLSNPWMIESGNEKQQGLTTYFYIHGVIQYIYIYMYFQIYHNQYHIYGTLIWSIGIQIHVISLSLYMYIYIALFPWRGTRRLAFWASERFFDTNSQPQAAWWLWSAQLPVSCGYGCLWRKKVWGNNREHDLYPEIKGLIFSSQPVWADKITVIFHWVITVDHWSCEPPTMGETGSWSIGPISEFIRFNTFNYGK